MKRDHELIRNILLDIEERHPGFGLLNYKFGDHGFDGVSDEALVGHIKLMMDAGLIEIPASQWISSSGVSIHGLTYRGYDILDSIRDRDIWNMAKENVLSVQDMGIEMLGKLARAYLKKKLEKVTGLELEGL